MKGMILTLCIICFGCAIFSAGLFVHNDEIKLNQINQAIKRSIGVSMNAMAEKEINQRTVDEAMQEFIKSFEVLAPKKIHYTIGMLGFSEHPLLIRIKVTASEDLKNSFSFEETMIEEVVEYEK